ncbi:MAG: calcium-binding protein [Pseudomonadota bacterium]
MRILVAIPHYYKPSSGFYGSQRADPGPRIEALTQCLAALHQNFGPRQGLLDPPRRCLSETNRANSAGLDVVLCTTGGDHLLHAMPQGLFTHRATEAQPMRLGYEAHAALRDGLGRYDWYCYMEDDILVADPLFFDKLAWFQSLAGERAALQPNRYEASVEDRVRKLYIDANLAKPELSEPFQDIRQRPRIEGEALGRRLLFQRVNNPHAGCFFLTEAQMRRWAAQDYFLDRSDAFAGPLESAATLGVMRCFDLYKPARENAAFLEVGHIHRRYIGRYVEFEDAAPWRFKVVKPAD